MNKKIGSYVIPFKNSRGELRSLKNRNNSLIKDILQSKLRDNNAPKKEMNMLYNLMSKKINKLSTKDFDIYSPMALVEIKELNRLRTEWYKLRDMIWSSTESKHEEETLLNREEVSENAIDYTTLPADITEKLKAIQSRMNNAQKG